LRGAADRRAGRTAGAATFERGILAIARAVPSERGAQEGRVDWIRRQFDTRTIVLIPIAIAINIVLGQTVAAALKVPIYLDSIGTIFVGVVAGPVAGLLTGLLTNLTWTYVLPPPFNSQYAAPFAIVAMEIGFLAGIFGRIGWFRSRPNTPLPQLMVGFLVVAAAVAFAFVYGFLPFYADGTLTFFGEQTDVAPIFVALSWAVAAVLVVAVVGFLYLLLAKRDLGVVFVAVGGAITGVVSAILVAAFQQAGSDLQTAVLQQGLLSDPIDKVLTFFIVFLLLQTLSRRFVARFPQGEKAIGLEGA
jgi:energy-coupling factor transport system substrate-specific component